MAKLSERQQRLLDTVKETRSQIEGPLRTLADDYEYAEFRAKAPVRDAIEEAEKGGVPIKRITEEGMGFTYPAKLRAWVQAPESVVRRLMQGTFSAPLNVGFEEVVASVTAVSRDDSTGRFSVMLDGVQHTVDSYGPPSEPWSEPNSAIPQSVYDLIKKEFPQWELIEDEEED